MSRERTSSDRAFGMTFAVFCGVVALLQVRGNPHAALAWTAAGAVFLGVAFVRARWLHPLNVVWTKFGLLLHSIVNPLVLGVMYFGVLTPTALVMRLRGADPMRKHFEPESPSYWQPRRPPGPPPQSLEDQF
jgi:hypothetical protein